MVDLPVSSATSLARRRERPEGNGVQGEHGRRLTVDVRAALLDAYATLGGVCEAEDVLARMREVHEQPLSVLARLIVHRELVAVAWHGTTLLPAFQLDRSSWLPRPEVRRVVRQLRDVQDDLELALWFAAGNASLGGCCPAELIGSDVEAVVDAARIERFIARW
jgi:hypothetical protein